MINADPIGFVSSVLSAQMCWEKWLMPSTIELWRTRCNEVFEKMGVVDTVVMMEMTEWLEKRFEKIKHKPQ